jgi:hypothetical protein
MLQRAEPQDGVPDRHLSLTTSMVWLESASFAPPRDAGPYARCSPRGQVSRQNGDCPEHQNDSDERLWGERIYLEQETLEAMCTPIFQVRCVAHWEITPYRQRPRKQRRRAKAPAKSASPERQQALDDQRLLDWFARVRTFTFNRCEVANVGLSQ